MYAPYTDTTLYPKYDISTVPAVNCFTLGFIVADNNKNPSWGGHYSIQSDYYQDILAALRQKGTKTICSFGGAEGKELATVTKSVNELFDKYCAVINKYSFDSIDFDIEGGALGDTKAIIRRAEAIDLLKKKYPKLKTSLTLPVMPDGLEKDALYCAKSTPCDLVNIMAMDYGSEPNMGIAACTAATETYKQIGKHIGITPMIGKNDTGEIFSLDNARIVKTFQQKNEWVKRLSIWAIERDRGIPGDLNHSSKISQKPFEFSSIFIR